MVSTETHLEIFLEVRFSSSLFFAAAAVSAHLVDLDKKIVSGAFDTGQLFRRLIFEKPFTTFSQSTRLVGCRVLH